MMEADSTVCVNGRPGAPETRLLYLYLYLPGEDWNAFLMHVRHTNDLC
jgi:hypothetical protein